VDANHAQIIDALRKAGICATSTAQIGGGFPDAAAGFRGVTLLLEIKSPGEKLNAAEVEWHSKWGGAVAVVDSPEAAIKAVLDYARGQCGVLL
jgi:hypothetical protein